MKNSLLRSRSENITMLKLIVALTFFVLVAGWEENYDNYQVFKIFPASEEEVDFVREFEEMDQREYSFWRGPSFVNNTVDLMVAPHKIDEFRDRINSTGIQYETWIEDVQALIVGDHESLMMRGSKVQFDWRKYYKLNEIYDYLKKMEKDYPDKVERIVAGKSYKGNKIVGVKLSFNKNNPGVFIEGGIHAREWISPATVTYIINELLTSQNPEIRQLAESNDWYIFPVVNPDGYEHSHTKDRLWRKSRKPAGKGCVGIDLNRNWDFQWKEGADKCAEAYGGSAPFSEKETKSFSEYITSISDKFYTYIAFHSYAQYLLLPYGFTEKHLDNWDEAMAVGTKAIEGLAKRYGTKYRLGNPAELLQYTTGISMDWVKSSFKTPLVFTYELRDTGDVGFLLPPEQIIPTGEETVDSLVALFKEARALGIPYR